MLEDHRIPDLPRARDLGPDPEPLGVRAAVLLARYERDERLQRTLAAEAVRRYMSRRREEAFRRATVPASSRTARPGAANRSDLPRA